MRCASCHKLSFGIFCAKCQKTFLSPQVTKRTIGTLEVYSFYSYNTLEKFLLTKHTPLGHRVFNALAKISFKPFIESLIGHDEREICVVGVDENVKHGYSHVAILTHSMSHKRVKILHGALRSKNDIKYSGKPLQYRLDNTRDFAYKGHGGCDIILVDDIVTTGLTLQQAYNCVTQANNNVLFALTLADAKQ